jgi:DAK2 domain fusion protein YloV
MQRDGSTGGSIAATGEGARSGSTRREASRANGGAPDGAQANGGRADGRSQNGAGRRWPHPASVAEPVAAAARAGRAAAPDGGGAATATAPAGVQAQNLQRFRTAVAGALAHLESRRQEINDLNVFPVADGDTGDNMALTLRAVLDQLDRLQSDGGGPGIEEIGRAEIVESVARAALLGARGNSGVILSQLIRGAVEELVSRPGELIDPGLLGAALLNAANRAYASVREPAEGTILTVAREMAHKIVADVAHSADGKRLEPSAAPAEQDAVIAEALEQALGVGQESVRRGPELLAALREAGVVDAGGYGLLIILAGVVAALRGDEPPALEHHAPARVSHPEHQSSTYRYCTNFAVTGHALVAASFIVPLEAIGDSVLVVGDASTLKVHVHTDDPEHATAIFADAGTISHLDVADMRVQTAARQERLTATDGAVARAAGARNGHAAPCPGGSRGARCGAVAVVNGGGLAALFAELGVHTIDGGPTLNPSTYELLAAIHQVDAEEVVVLPCSPNVLMAAERAAELSDKHVAVVRATTQQAGLAASVALMPDAAVDVNAQALEEALAAIRAGAVAEAAREDPLGRFARGEAVGLLDEEVVSWGDPGATLKELVARMADGSELVSIIAGRSAPLGLAEVERLLDGAVEAELELREGGQDAYWWLLSAE